VLAITLATDAGIAGCSKNTGTAPDSSNKRWRPGQHLDFALDIDTASYTYAARTINDGSRADASKVRPEEFVNYFDQNYPEPRVTASPCRPTGAPAAVADRPACCGRACRRARRTRSIGATPT
jgi:Ca-activated chloride channel family protein